jgi:GT2 family glycosyltransferase
MIDLSVIIVSYNSSRHLERCLNSIKKSSDNLQKEVIVLDNNSRDKSIEILQKYTDYITIIQNKRNSGYAGGNNLAYSISKGKFLLFLNPDTSVFPDSIAELHLFANKHPEAGIIGPQLIFPDGTTQRYFCNFYSVRSILLRRSLLGMLFRKSLYHPLEGILNENVAIELDWLLGSALFISRKNFEECGMFDEKYRLYFEDVDICYRIKKRGLKVLYYPKVKIVHDHQRESANGFSKKTLWHIQSAIKFFNKNGWRF